MREKLHQTLRDYDPKDIFNCDETIHETEIISVLTIPEVKMVKIISELNL